MKTNNYKLVESLVYFLLWILVFSAPFVFMENPATHPRGRQFWVMREIVRILPFLLIFLLNNFILFEFFKRRKYLLYFGVTLVAIILISYIAKWTPTIFDWVDHPGPGRNRPMGMMRNPRGFMGTPVNLLFNNIIISILVVGFNNAIKIGINWMEDRKNYEELQKENFRTQLAYLKHQVSPHFFMNTLNNIHALIDIEKEKAKEAVVKLSTLMRVLLYETDAEKISLKKEISFIRDYIELMRMRVDENVDIRFDHPAEIPEVKIPPLLFISFVENAFKHGIRASGKSFIHVEYEVDDDENLRVNVRNSKAKQSGFSGWERIGLSNSEKRLDLLYKDRYSFEILDLDDSFEVLIKIPLK